MVSLFVTRNNIIGKSEYKKIENYIKTVLDGNTGVFEALLNFATAGLRHVEVNCVPDLEEEVTKGFFLFINDISRYKDIEVALTKQRDLAQNLIRTAQDIVLVLDTEGKITRVNPYFEKLTGYTSDEVEGKDWFSTFLPKLEQERLSQVFHNAVENEKISGNINSIVTKDGREPLIDWYSTTLKDENGKTTGVLSLDYDITDRHHMELTLRDRDRQLALLTDALPVLITYIDKHQHYQFINKAYEEWFSLSRAQIEGQSVRTVLGDAAYKKVEGHIRRVLLGEKSQYEGILPFLHGDERYVIAHFKPHFDDNDKIKGYMTLVTDISEFTQLEEKNRRQQVELARILRIQTIGEMTSTLAHELNQPLSAISSYALASLRLFESDGITKNELREVLEALSFQAQRAGEIIRGIRRLIKKEETQRQWLDINKVIQQAVQFCDAEARQHDVKIVLDLKQSLPPVFADETQLQQVILNLVRNGIEALVDHTHESRELIATSKVDKNVVIDISDNGPGLQPEAIDNLFSPLTTTKSFGLGFGARISYQPHNN